MLCLKSDLLPNAGVCALYDNEQVAIFYMPDQELQLYAINNCDPIANANVLSRGIVGDIDGRLSVASPLYKQHFDLLTGQCLEDNEVKVKIYQLEFDHDKVVLLGS